MAGKLPETANINGGTVTGVDIFDSAEYLVTETVARLPSFYSGLASAAGDALRKNYTMNANDLGFTTEFLPDITVTLRVVAQPTGTDVVQHAIGSAVAYRRKATGASTWSAWKPAVARALAAVAATNGGTIFGDPLGSFDANTANAAQVADRVADLTNALIYAGILDAS
jgi:hypothetical protein